MIRRVAFLALVALPLASAAPAQEPGRLVRYGKWVLAAGAVGMNLLAAREHNRADEAFDTLRRRCFEDFSLCAVGPDGTYLNPSIESLYQWSLHYDRRARTWLFGGEAALLGAGVMFVWELTRKTDKPDNIPFEPELRSLNQATGVGVRVWW